MIHSMIKMEPEPIIDKTAIISVIRMIEGTKVSLRRLLESDLIGYCRWYGNPEVTSFLGMKPLSRDKAEASFNQIVSEPVGEYFGITKNSDGSLIGYIFLTGILKSHRVARELGIVIGDPEDWGHGYGTEATRLILDYGFRELNLHRVELLVLDYNQRARRVYEKLGFVFEGVQREARWIDDQWRDVIQMSLLEGELIEAPQQARIIKLPKRVQNLMTKYGDCEIVQVTQNVSSNPESTNKPLFGIGVFVKTKEGEYVLLRHSYDLPGLTTSDWTFPGGKLEENESFEEAAIRETLEETGIPIEIIGLYKIFHHIHISNGNRETESFMPVLFGEVLSEMKNHLSSEVLQTKKFKELPRDFGGIFHRYYKDLM